MSFEKKYKNITKENKSYLCVGLDSELAKIPSFLKTEPEPMLVFNKRIIEETYQYVAAYKPNFAFYISEGSKGIDTLRKTIEFIPKNIPVILDIKAGDIGNTMEQYAKSVFEYFCADAMTINILMGTDVILACLKGKNAFGFALVLTSNSSAADFLTQNDLYERLAEKVNMFGHEKLGAVVGATQTEYLSQIRTMMPDSIFLVPGIGSQGGELETVCKNLSATNEEPLFLINSSRGIIFADSTKHFAEVAQTEAINLKDNINKYLNR